MNPFPHQPGVAFLHARGPARLPSPVARALRTQPMELGAPALDRLIADSGQGLARLFGAGPGVELLRYAAHGHSAWEAALQARGFAHGPGIGRAVQLLGAAQ